MPPETSLKYLTTAISQGRLVSFPWPSEEKGWLLSASTKWSIGHHYHKWSCLLRFASGRQNFSQLGSSDTPTEGMTENRGLLHEEKQLYFPKRILRHILHAFGDMTF